MDEKKPEETQNLGEPHVRIFGEEVGGSRGAHDDSRWRQERREARRQLREHWRQDGDFHHHHHHHVGNTTWGLALLLGGFLLLLNTFGLIPWTIWNYIWPFWPVVLLLIGLRLVLGWGRLAETITFLAALALFGFIILFALQQIGSPLINHLPQSIINLLNNFRSLNLPTWPES